jgi:hypothetical protein
VPVGFVDTTNRALQPADDTGIGDLVEDEIGDQAENFIGQVLGQLCNKNQSEPAGLGSRFILNCLCQLRTLTYELSEVKLLHQYLLFSNKENSEIQVANIQ